ncbi:PSD1 and planctomycete cytochrome C domain-containing protein [Akkermansiaceae bacterium]|nr:PSD1 and planctomycete cytochrome C domain-containing protein [Akkermansiaceae bacterium]
MVERNCLYPVFSLGMLRGSFRRPLQVCLGLWLGLLLPGFGKPEMAEAEILFVEKIRPLLESKCGGCHGDAGKKIKGDYDMRSRAGLLRGGESGDPSLVPGKPDDSPMFIAVTWKDSDLEMPPKENDRLDAKQIAELRSWIEAGAPWVENEVEAPMVKGKLGSWSEPDSEGLVRVKLTKAESESWANRGYDPKKLWAFRKPARSINTPLQAEHPIDAFIDHRLKEKGLAPGPKAEAGTLNRRLSYTLTGLPPTAEELAMPYEKLMATLMASPHYGERMAQQWLDVTRYADSNGFARDDERPDAHIYRSYVIESFNADKPYDRFVKEQIAGDELELAGQEALAFLWMGPFEMTAMTSAAVARQMWLDDVVNSVGVTFLGQELRCAKCHDHKFDPIPTRDYYSMQAIFGSTDHHVKLGEYEVRKQKPIPIQILKGGSLESPTEKVGPGLLSALTLTGETKVPNSAQGRRAALANWIASSDNSLTARVMVNRVWAWHFGRGIVATPNGFGSMGAKPSHPELLDWLANWFVENDWSVKKLNELILSSETYRRSAGHPELAKVREKDPDGLFLASFPPRRLSAEEIRDSMLVASGELNRRVGGVSFQAEINWEVAFQARLAMGKVLPPWEPEAKRKDRNRRSLYAKRIRNLGHPLMEVLNRPPSELSCERRDETTVVTQAFSLFHGEFSNQRALALADMASREKPGDLEAQIERVFLGTLARKPRADELARSRRHVKEMVGHHQAHPPVENELPTEVTLTNVIEKTGEPAYTKFALKRLANYERDLQPWEVSAETRALSDLCLVLLNSSEFLHVY